MLKKVEIIKKCKVKTSLKWPDVKRLFYSPAELYTTVRIKNIKKPTYIEITVNAM